MKSILERALVHLLKEENEKAQELMHQFVVERAKEIHLTLREGDENSMEDMDEALEEEVFTEADLEDAEAVDQLEDDLDDSDAAAAEGDVDLADAEVGGEVADEGNLDMGMDVDAEGDMGAEAGEGDIEDKLDGIADEIASLQAEFDKIMSEFEGDDAVEGEDADAAMGDDVAMADASEITDAEEEEDFDDITESMVDELKKVSTPNVDGNGADGKKLATPTKSPIAKDAKPTVLASKNGTVHTGNELEKAPSKKDGKKYDNVRAKAKDGTASVPATGPKGAELNKPVAGNTKSVIPGSKKR